MADGEAKKKDEILIEIDQKMINQKNPLQIVIEVMRSEMIEESKGTSNVTKRATSKETV